MRKKLMLLSLLAFALIVLFLTYDVRSWEYALPRRLTNVSAMVITGAAIAFSTVVFQTITHNRILTPGIIGLGSLYVLVQTFLIFAFGSMSFWVVDKHANFLLTSSVMIVFALLLYTLLFKKGTKHLFFLLLVGIVFGTFFSSLSTFMQVLIDPNEFLSVQNRMFASFSNVNNDILLLTAVIFVITTAYVLKLSTYLDVLSLGRDHAINLGVDYDYVVKRLLIVVAILVSVSTALVGPITFLGLLVANVAYELMKTYKHTYILAAAVLVSVIALVGGQLIVERIFAMSTPLSVIINFAGGMYFLYLLLKEGTKWSKS
ncbi:iron chelate uptake ABC transporter family permease subunit [Alteribacter aurantiacus]|uniref:iron chelate uptake ABC transporter family permease subunit n=1 Tax=Alteribacter aurantiacus TaxID=254410 RepID=UPI000406BBF8|nr:iron chelate uptake ABC transporter family permease subunit [Alteribacter aurantiacus]